MIEFSFRSFRSATAGRKKQKKCMLVVLCLCLHTLQTSYDTTTTRVEDPYFVRNKTYFLNCQRRAMSRFARPLCCALKTTFRSGSVVWILATGYTHTHTLLTNIEIVACVISRRTLCSFTATFTLGEMHT